MVARPMMALLMMALLMMVRQMGQAAARVAGAAVTRLRALRRARHPVYITP